MSINEEIKNLKEAFDNLFETGITVNKLADAAQKRIDDNPYIDMTSRGKEELERIQALAKLPRTGEGANNVKRRYEEESNKATSDAVKAMLRGDKEDQEKKEQEAWDKGLVAVDNKGYCFNKWKAPKKMNDNNSLQEQILELKEAFDEIFERKNLQAAQKAVGSDIEKMGVASKALDQDWNDKNAKQYNKAVQKFQKDQAEEQRLTPKINIKYLAQNEPKLIPMEVALRKKIVSITGKPEMNDNNSLQEQILTLKEAFDSLFEETIETEQSAKEKEVSSNKISKKKKGKDGKETEVVSVADELFPYEGNAKQQYNQKIIAKINDMIEGTATLQDLIQLVRQKKVASTK